MAHRGKTPKMQLLEAQDGKQRSIERILLDAYAKGGTQAAAAEIVGISASLYNHWLVRLGIQLPEKVA
jgi:hypothetical protein